MAAKEVRRLRAICKGPVANDCFQQPTPTITNALDRIGAAKKPRKQGLGGDVAALVDSLCSPSVD